MDERVDERERAAEERRSRRERLLDRVERITEAPLLILAAVMIPLIVGPFVWDLSARQEQVFFTADIFIWAVFVADLVVKTAIAPRRIAYLKSHWLDLAILVAPPIRPLRLVRLFVYGSRLFMGVRRMVQVDYLLVYAVLLVMVSATVVTTVETGENAQISSFSDAMWWATVTITTIGYGDLVPVSEAGRAMGYVLRPWRRGAVQRAHGELRGGPGEGPAERGRGLGGVAFRGQGSAEGAGGAAWGVVGGEVLGIEGLWWLLGGAITSILSRWRPLRNAAGGL